MIVFDIEANGLDNVTELHCIVAKDINTNHTYRFYDDCCDISRLERDFRLCKVKDYFNSKKVLIGHNIIGYDNDLLNQFFNLDLSNKTIIDTLVMSQVLNPDRKLPAKCPTMVFNPITGKNDKIGPHSLTAWGYRVGRSKPEHYDWGTFSPEMLHRCTEDVEIQVLVFYKLLEEAGMDFDEFKEDYLK